MSRYPVFRYHNFDIMSLDVFEISGMFEEYFQVGEKGKQKTKQKHGKKTLVYIFRQCLGKPIQVAHIACRHRPNNPIVFSTDQGRLYNIPNVYLGSSVHWEHGIVQEYDTPADNDKEGNGKKISATEELMDFLQSDPMIWKRINYPVGVTHT